MEYKLCFIACGVDEDRKRASQLIRENNLLCIELDSIDMVLDACKTVIPEMIVLDDENSKTDINQWVDRLRAMPRGGGPMVLLRDNQISGDANDTLRARMHRLHTHRFYEELNFFLQDA